jgi:hypothetical protein
MNNKGDFIAATGALIGYIILVAIGVLAVGLLVWSVRWVAEMLA